ncbi:MAG: small subunit ribosomal protein S1, partial [Myxococcota bacterium]
MAHDESGKAASPTTPATASADGDPPNVSVTVTAGPNAVRRRTTETPMVIDKGQGKRDAIALEQATAAKAAEAAQRLKGGVTVTEDVDFEALMAGQAQQRDRAFEPGTKLSGVVEVVSLHGQEIFLDLGGKATGYILKEELVDHEGNLHVKPGDTVEGIVVGTTSHGVHLRVKLGADGDSQALRDAFEAAMPVEGKVLSTNKGGYEVLVAGQRAFCPHSQIDLARPADPEAMVGRVFDFKITEMRPGSVVVSRTALLRAGQAERMAETLASLTVGARLTGTVRSIQNFGVFVDLGGVDGLVHVSELGWDRVEDPHKVVELGQEVVVVVTEINTAKERIGLSMKQAQGDPFEGAVGGLSIGNTVTGTVARLAQFGAFITIADGVDGLIHISDLAHHRVRTPSDILSVGDTIQVKIMEVDLARRRVGLSLKALAADPWDGIAERYTVGKPIKGKVESVQDFGVFVTLEDGVTALLPASESNTDGQPMAVAFRLGMEIEAKVLRVDIDDKKMALTRRED